MTVFLNGPFRLLCNLSCPAVNQLPTDRSLANTGYSPSSPKTKWSTISLRIDTELQSNDYREHCCTVDPGSDGALVLRPFAASGQSLRQALRPGEKDKRRTGSVIRLLYHANRVISACTWHPYSHFWAVVLLIGK